jgi:hypothetical protein
MEEIVLDDELIGSGSSDVEMTTLSHKNAGTERRVVGAVADSHTV